MGLSEVAGPPDAGLELGLVLALPFSGSSLSPLGGLAGAGEPFEGVPDGAAEVVTEEVGSAFKVGGGGLAAGGVEAGIQLELELMLMLIPIPTLMPTLTLMLMVVLVVVLLWPETGTGFAAPGTQPGTSLPVAGAGPSVTATQPGRLGMRPRTFSEGIGLGAEHEFVLVSGRRRFSFLNTGQSSMTPEAAVHVCIARESTLLSHPSMKSPCSP